MLGQRGLVYKEKMMGVMSDMLGTDLNAGLSRSKVNITVNPTGTYNVDLVMGSTMHPKLYENIDGAALAAAVDEFTTWIAAKISLTP